jgi:Zn-dependent protease with chaperone function
MPLRNTSNPERTTTSLLRFQSLWRAGFLVFGAVCAHAANANQVCAGSLRIDQQAVDLDTCRPSPIGADEKSIVLKSLPTEGEVTRLSQSERRKVNDLNSVLRLHHRDRVYEIKVISIPQAWTGLYARAVLLISLPVLRLLDSGELQALVAHEIGHEYFWQAFAAADQVKNSQRLRELELACDAIAVLTLERVGVNPDRLSQALEKVSRFNRERFGWATNESSYPSVSARRNLVKAMSTGGEARVRIAHSAGF